MKTTKAAVGSTIWFALAPGVVAGLVPWLLTSWQARQLGSYWVPMRVIGAMLIGAGGAVLLHAFARFVVEGRGTPAPAAPPDRLVIGGLYRYVRNPMYLAVVAAIVGQALVLAQFGLLWYAAAVTAVVAGFVHLYEEPALSQRFGDSYEDYRRAVGRWRPRLRPLIPSGQETHSPAVFPLRSDANRDRPNQTSHPGDKRRQHGTASRSFRDHR